MNAVRAYQRSREARDRLVALTIRRSFAEFGKGATLRMPFRMWGEQRISIGNATMIEANSWLLALDPGGRITIGDSVQASGMLVVSAVAHVQIGSQVLLARNVYISDHSHRHDLPRPIRLQGITEPEPVTIGFGAWIGQNVVILPGVRIGAYAVVGANSVVRYSVPDWGVAVGAPARVVAVRDPDDLRRNEFARPRL